MYEGRDQTHSRQKIGAVVVSERCDRGPKSQVFLVFGGRFNPLHLPCTWTRR